MAKSLLKQYFFRYRKNSNRGSLLVVAIWALVFFSLLSVGLYSIVSSYADVMKRVEERILGRHLAMAAYYDALAEINSAAQEDAAAADQKKSEQAQSGSHGYRYRYAGEDSRININNASKDILARLPGMDADTADKIMLSKLRPFYAKEEVLLVDGVSRDKYDAFKDFITVYGDGKVNINTAPPEVLKALGMGDGLISQIEEFKAGPDGKAGTKDDEAFKSFDEILTALKWISEEEKTLILNIQSRGTLTTQSKIYSVNVDTEISGRKGQGYTIITDGVKILRWIE